MSQSVVKRNVFFSQIIAVFIIALLAGSPAFAAPAINKLEKKGLFGWKNGSTAIHGYDPVAYFTIGKPLKGKKAHTTVWQGATWKFATAEHQQLFESAPESYAPQFGGYCAYGVAEGTLVKIDPNSWEIVDGKLYLNFNAKFHKRWQSDRDGYIERAQQRFSTLLGKT